MFALMTAATATAQTQVMNIYKTDGTKLTYKVADVQQVLFEEVEEPEVTLNNQYAHNADVTDIKSVVVSESTGEYAGYTVAFFAQEGVTDFATADPLLSLFVYSASVGQTLDLSEGTALVQDASCEFVQPAGTLTLSFDRLGNNINVSLDMNEASSEVEQAQRVRVEYNGAFETTYQTSDELVITSADSSVLLDQAITSVLRQQPAETGGATFFGLGDANASTAVGYLEGKYGVLFSVSAAKLGSTVDLATETDSYTFKLIDYTAGTVDEAVASGTITTIEKDGKVYIALNATMTSGVTVAFDYFAAVTDVDDITPMIPVSKLSNAYEYYDSDGNISDTQTITTVQYKTSGGGYTTFYLMPDGAGYNAYSTTTPQLQVKTEWITSTPTTYDLSALQAEDYFRFRFKGMDLCSPDSKYYGYSNTPNNGTLTISQDADGNYDIYLEISNSYSNSYTTNGGDNTKVVLAYTGAATSR